MSIPYNLLRVRIDTKAICSNYQRLHSIGGNAIAVVKSDAYGHGLKEVAAALDAAGCRRMAVGTVEEAVYLRDTGFAGQVIALLGPQNAEDDLACLKRQIMPFISHEEQLKRLARTVASRTADQALPLCLKFDTGMRRLGFAAEQIPALVPLLRDAPQLRLSMVASHLATADTPEEEAFVHKQGREFEAICAQLRKEPGTQKTAFECCLANSGGILAFPKLRLDAQRPGIAMYGANPFHGTGWEELGAGFAPGMEVSAPVLQVRELAPGDTVSYGRTFRADKPLTIAIVAAGYADAYSRGLSRVSSTAMSKGPSMLLHGQRAPVVGRVCMQMTAVDVTHIPRTRPGDVAHLLGGQGKQAIRAEELAYWWGTISYEVFCLLGMNPRG